MVEPKQMKLHNYKVMTTPQHVKCMWCEHGRDPGKEGICSACHLTFKRLLNCVAWRTLRRTMLFDPATSFCKGYLLPGLVNTVLIPCRQQIPIPAFIIDHIEPWRYKPSLFWEPTNHQAICLDCNAAKTQADGSFNHSSRGQK